MTKYAPNGMEGILDELLNLAQVCQLFMEGIPRGQSPLSPELLHDAFLIIIKYG